MSHTSQVAGVSGSGMGVGPVVFPEDRQQVILTKVQERGSVASSDLAEELAVNQATIRRDLKRLADEGLVDLVHGGARRRRGTGPLVHEIDLQTKKVTNLQAKEIIAAKAAALVEPGSTIALNSGSTVEMLARRIPADIEGCTFVTLSLNVAATLTSLTRSTLMLAGGVYRARSESFVGDAAATMLEGLRADLVFLGASAVDLTQGWTHPALEEVRPNQMMLAMAPRRYLVCDSSKFGTTGLARIAALSEFTGIVSDDDLSPEVRDWAQHRGLEVI
ncbi:MAG: DeoR/GlpR family DNA-binding transcription regulator [Propioniciclava sp.]